MPHAAPPPPVVAPAPSPSLDALRARNRVLLVFAPGPDDRRLQYQEEELRRLMRGPDTRDLHLVAVVGMRVDGASDSAAALRARFHIVLGGFRTFLIGKDGHEAARSDSPIPAEEIAHAIDSMPMRRQEMKRR